MNDSNKNKKKSVSADIPESAFEEALKAVETIERERKLGKKKNPDTRRPKSNDYPDPDANIEDEADDLDSLLNLLDVKGKITSQKAPKRVKPGMDQPGGRVHQIPEEDEILADLLGEDIDLEKEAQFFRSVLFGETEKAEATLREMEKQPAAPLTLVDRQNLEQAHAEAARKDEEIKDLQEKVLRVQAEFENYRKRVIRDAKEAKKFYNEKVILELLPIVDNFERAIEHMINTGENKSMLEGVELIYRQIVGMLEMQGVQAIDTHDERFNPLYHEAVASIYKDDVEPGSILTEYETGYLLNGRLLRPSRVLVATNEKDKATFHVTEKQPNEAEQDSPQPEDEKEEADKEQVEPSPSNQENSNT